MMLTKPWRAMTLWTAVVLAPSLAQPVPAQPVLVKMATPVPDGSSWFLILQEMAQAWKAASGGRVVMRIYPGGVAGDDADVVRKMQLGRLQAGLLTTTGLAEIDPSVLALSMPLLFRDEDEASAVLDRMRPRLDAAFAAKGFVIVSWGAAGWMHFFTQEPVATPDDLRSLSLLTLDADPRITDVWRSAGFKPVPVPATGMMRALEASGASALSCPPHVASIAGYANHAKNMTNLRWHLLLGATVIRKEAWEQIPADARPALRQAAAEAGLRLQAEIQRDASRDVAAMQKRGLNVVAVDARARARWETLAAGLYPRLRGHIVPKGAFDEAMRYRDEYRRRRTTGGGRS